MTAIPSSPSRLPAPLPFTIPGTPQPMHSVPPHAALPAPLPNIPPVAVSLPAPLTFFGLPAPQPGHPVQPSLPLPAALSGTAPTAEGFGYLPPDYPYPPQEPLCQPASVSEPKLRALTFAEFIAANQDRPREWIVDGLLPASGVVMLAGDALVGKTIIVELLAAAMTTATPFLGRATQPGSMLLLKLEHGDAGFADQLEAVARGAGVAELDLAILTPTREQGVDLFSDESLGQVVDEVQRVDPAVIVVDCLRAAGNFDENSSQQVADLRRRLVPLTDSCSRLVILIHHTDKKSARSPRGSGDLVAQVDSMLTLTRSDGALAMHAKHHFGAPVDVRFRLDFSNAITVVPLDPSCQPAPVPNSMAKPDAQRDQIIEIVRQNPEISKTELAKRAGGNAKKTRALIDSLVHDAFLTASKQGNAKLLNVGPSAPPVQPSQCSSAPVLSPLPSVSAVNMATTTVGSPPATQWPPVALQPGGSSMQAFVPPAPATAPVSPLPPWAVGQAPSKPCSPVAAPQGDWPDDGDEVFDEPA